MGIKMENLLRNTALSKRYTCIILCLSIFIGATTGCGAAAETIKTEKTLEEYSDSLTSVEGSDTKTTDTVTPGDAPESVNAVGLPLMDSTTLLVTVIKHRFTDDYIFVREQYEYDNEGRMLRYMEEPSRGNFSDIEYEYGADGNLLRKTCYDVEKKEKKLDYWVEYSYAKDEAGELVSWTERKYNVDGSLDSESGYDSEGTLLNKIRYVENIPRYQYEYDDSMRQMWETLYDGQGNVVERHEEKYDDAGNLLLRASYDAEGNLDVFEGYECDTYVVIYPYWTYENTYDDTGNLIRQVMYDYEHNETDISEYTYDETGKLVREFFSDEMVTEETEYRYDAVGNRIQDLEVVYEYDSGRPIRTDAVLPKWEWEFDRRNRLVKSTDYSWGKPEYWYEFEYETIGVSDDDYSYDKINMPKYIYYSFSTM